MEKSKESLKSPLRTNMYDQQGPRIQNKHTKNVFVYTSYKSVDIIEINNISFIIIKNVQT